MAGITQDMKNYIEDRFFDEKENTRLVFKGISDEYGDSGLDEVIKDICPRIPDEYNKRVAVYSLPGKTARKYKNDYTTVKEIHEKEDMILYGIEYDGITRKNPGMESDFIDII